MQAQIQISSTIILFSFEYFKPFIHLIFLKPCKIIILIMQFGILLYIF
jgi:hypothetical protein